MGSPGYMVPEQYAGIATSAATDQFAFCIALYEALYGARPFLGKTLPELSHATNLGKVPLPPKGSTVPPWIHAVIARGLSVDPANRHPSMAALLLALAKDPAQVLRRRVAIGAAVFVLAAIGGSLVYLQQQQVPRRRGDARARLGCGSGAAGPASVRGDGQVVRGAVVADGQRGARWVREALGRSANRDV